jgi:hypothetical protein
MPAEPLRVERGRAYFESDIKTLDDQNDIFECVVTDSGSKDHALSFFTIGMPVTATPNLPDTSRHAALP